MTDRRTAAAAATAAARTVLTHARNTLLSSVAAVRGAGQAVTEHEIPAKVSTAAHTWTAANWTKIRSTAAAAPRTWPAASRNKILAAAGLVACALITMVVTAGDGGTLAAAAAGPAAAPGTSPIKADPGGTRPPAPAGPADSGTTTGGAPDPSHRAAPTSAWCVRAFGINCYSPRQLQQAYDLPPLYARGLDGQGRTIVVVDAYGSPTIRHDLQVFDAGCGLPGPPSLRIIQPVGRVPRYDADDQDMVDAAAETTTDVEAAHSMAPGASILLVETPADETLSGGGFAQFMAAENYVVRHGLGDVISQSFGLPEQNFGQATIRQLRYAFQNAARHHVTVPAAANDFGVTGPTWPPAGPHPAGR